MSSEPSIATDTGARPGAPARSNRQVRLLFAVSMVVMGACGIVYEYVLSVLGNYLIGSSHEEIFIVIGLMMFAMGVGSFAQRMFATDLVDKFLLLEIALGVLGGFSATAVYSLFAVSESYRIVLYFFAFSIGTLIGMEIPILIRINKRYSASLKTNLAEILSMDYVGSLLGALLFTYVLLKTFSLAKIAFILGLANVSVAAFGAWQLTSLVRRRKSILSCLAVAGGALVVGLLSSARWDAWAEQKYFQDPIAHCETSLYQHIVITNRNDRGHDITKLYLNGHLQFSSRDEAIYHEMLVHPALLLADRRAHVLILGGGDGLAVRECLKYDDVESITLVDIDDAVTRLAREDPRLVAINGHSLDDARVETLTSSAITPSGRTTRPTMRSQRSSQFFSGVSHELAEVDIYNVDADVFLRQVAGQFDVVFVDFPDPSRLEVAKLYSRTFYRQLLRRMSPGACVTIQSASPYYAAKVFACIGKTLRSVGLDAVPYHENVPSFGEWGFHIAKNGADAEVVRKQLRGLAPIPVATRYLTPELLAAATHFGKGWLGQVDVLPNERMNPVIVDYYSKSWSAY